MPNLIRSARALLTLLLLCPFMSPVLSASLPTGREGLGVGSEVRWRSGLAVIARGLVDRSLGLDDRSDFGLPPRREVLPAGDGEPVSGVLGGAWIGYLGYVGAVGLGLAWWFARRRCGEFAQRQQILQSDVQERDLAIAERERQLLLKSRQLELALAQADASEEKAKAADAAKQLFLSNVNYEIRTPMNGILGMCSLMRHTDLDDEQTEFLDTIKASGESLLGIVNDILDFSNIEAGRLELTKTSFDLSQCVEGVIDLLGHSVELRQLQLYLEIDYNLELRRVGDPTRLRQILANLVNNSIKFTRQGWVSVRVSAAGADRLRIEVKDSGLGIEPDKVDALFQPFSQVGLPGSDKMEGTAVGLSICKALVEAMEGGISVSSVVGEGTSIVVDVEVPIDRGLVQGNLRDRLSRDKAPVGRVLVYSSRPKVLEYFAACLSSLGWSYVCEADFSKLVPTVKEGVGLMILDCEALPSKVENVVFACRACHAGKGALPTILLSRHSSALEDLVRRETNLCSIQMPLKPSNVISAFGGMLNEAWTAVAPRRVTLENLKQAHAIANLRILLVEDNFMNQQVLSKMLSSMGAHADLASDGVEALAAAVKGKYDLILMDLQLPLKDGFQTTREIRERLGGSTPAIYAVSANVDPEYRERCEQLGMAGFVTKPIIASELRDVLEAVSLKVRERV